MDLLGILAAGCTPDEGEFRPSADDRAPFRELRDANQERLLPSDDWHSWDSPRRNIAETADRAEDRAKDGQPKFLGIVNDLIEAARWVGEDEIEDAEHIAESDRFGGYR